MLLDEHRGSRLAASRPSRQADVVNATSLDGCKTTESFGATERGVGRLCAVAGLLYAPLAPSDKPTRPSCPLQGLQMVALAGSALPQVWLTYAVESVCSKADSMAAASIAAVAPGMSTLTSPCAFWV